MTTAATYLGLLAQLLQRLSGPIFDKELRVASRRVRWYVLRVGYAVALTFLVGVTWNATMHAGSAVVLASRMPEVAKTVTTAVTWLQFLAAQGLAVILLSSAIGEEIRKGTLSALLTTPITSFQIVVGKLLSRMLQVLMLLAISLPVLAILRLFGGVPWEFLLAGGSITLATTLFAGTLSLWLSTHYRYGSKAISAVLLVGILLFVVPEVVVSLLSSYRVLNPSALRPILAVTNPYHALSVVTTELWSPRVTTARALAPWMANSLILLGLTLFLLVLTIRRVRRAAVQSMTSEKRSIGAAAGRVIKRVLWGGTGTAKPAGPVKHVNGSPVVWKETRRGLMYGWSLGDIVVCAIALATAVVPILIFGLAEAEPVMAPGLFIAWLLSVLVVLRLAVECAGNVPREREARTWPILLTTLLEDREVVNGKAKAALLRNLPLLATLVAISLFLLVVFPRPETLLVAGWGLVSLVASILLIMGIGSYFGVTVKTRVGAVVATIVVCLMLKYGIGWMFAMVGIPLTARSANGGAGLLGFFIAIVVPGVIYAIIGISAIRVAAQRVRHDVF